MKKIPSYKNAKVLVTGGAGFIGSHLVEALLAKGAKVTIYDNMMRGEESFRNLKEIFENSRRKPEVVVADVLDFEKVKKHVAGKDYVFHLAALPSHRLALHQPRQYALVDIIGTVNVLEAARLTKSKPKVILASSNKVYGKSKPPFKEDMPLAPEGPYGQAKKTAEEMCYQYNKYYGVDTPFVRFHHAIGPRCQPDLALSIFTERVIQGKKPIVHGHFEGKKFISCAADFTNVFDAVRGIMLVAGLKGYQVFNLGTGKLTTVEQIARLVMKYLDKEDLGIEYREMLPHESLVHLADISKAKKVLGFEAKTPVEESVRQYVEWRLRVGPRPSAVYRV